MSTEFKYGLSTPISLLLICNCAISKADLGAQAPYYLAIHGNGELHPAHW
ncbi:MAG: hypothetical protein ACK41T_04430 [Pseudobdellovibrio sp.]